MGQFLMVVCRDEIAVHPIGDDFRVAAHRGGHHRHPQGEVLEDAVGKTLRVGAEDAYIEPGGHGGDVREGAKEADSLIQAHFTAECFQLWPEPPFSDNLEPGVGHPF